MKARAWSRRTSQRALDPSVRSLLDQFAHVEDQPIGVLVVAQRQRAHHPRRLHRLDELGRQGAAPGRAGGQVAEDPVEVLAQRADLLLLAAQADQRPSAPAWR